MERKDFRIKKTIDGEKIVHLKTGQESVTYKRKGDASKVISLILSGVLPFCEETGSLVNGIYETKF